MKKDKWHPGRLLEVSGSYWLTCALHTGVKLDVFTVIGRAQVSGKDAAEKVQGDERGTVTLLNALAAAGLLEKQGDLFSNTPESYQFLSKTSPDYLGFMIMHHHHLMASWNRLDEAVIQGQPVRGRSAHQSDETRESFLMGMFNIGMMTAPKAADAIDLSGKKTLLDIGGGPGTFAIHFCLKNPDLKAVVYDLPATRPFAEKTIARFGLNDRVAFCDGDFVEKPIEGRFDAAWLSHILHGESPDDCQKIIKKAVAALNPGGIIGIHEFILNNAADGPLFPALFSLNMLTGTSEGRAYTEAQLTDMLGNAGVKDIQRLEFNTPNDSGIITGAV